MCGLGPASSLGNMIEVQVWGLNSRRTEWKLCRCVASSVWLSQPPDHCTAHILRAGVWEKKGLIWALVLLTSCNSHITRVCRRQVYQDRPDLLHP